MAEEQVVFQFRETGAEILGAKVKATTKSIRDMENAMKNAFSVGGKGSIGRGLDDIGRSADRAKDKVGALARGLTYMGAAITGIAIRKFVGDIIHMVDAFTNLQNKIKVVTEGTDQLAFIQHELFQMSRETRTGIDAVATVYTRTARSVKDLGKSQLETLKFTETLSKAVAVGGSTAVEASNAMIQLSQGLSSGTLRGDELRSVLEQLPVVARMIADHLGVSVGQLRALGAAGKLTSEQVFDAIIAGTEKTNAAFDKLNPKVGESFGVLVTKATEASGALQPFFTDVANGLLKLADNFDLVVKGGTAFVQVVGVMLAAKAIPTAIRAIVGLNAALATNPFGLVALGIAAATAALLPFADELGDSADSMITMRDVWETFKKKLLSGLNDVKNSFAGVFDAVGVSLYIESLDKVLMKLAKAADFMAMIQPGTLAAVASGAISFEDASTRNQRGMASFLANAKGEAADRQAREFQKNFADTNARFNAFVNDQMPGAHVKTQKPVPPKAPGGTTFADLLREQQDALGVLQSGQLQIRPDGGQITLPSQMNGPMFLASPEEQAVAKQLESVIDRLGKKQPSMTPQQIGQLEDLIRQQQGLVAAKKEQEEIEAEITKRLDEQLKLEIQLIENQRKMQLQDDFTRGIADIDTANSLDPDFSTKQRIAELEQFRDTPGRIHEQAAAAQLEITKLRESMNPLAVAFQGVADTMVQGFSDAIARSIVLRENLGSLMTTLAKLIAVQAISGLISTGINAGMGALMSTNASAVAGNTAGTGGPGLLGGRVPQFAVGGYTGSSGGVVHPNEYVLNPQATRAMGIANLNAINSGGGSGGMAPSVVVNNHAGADVSVDEEALTRGEVIILIQKHGPASVAGAMNERNSNVAKSLRRNFNVEPRNV